MIKIFVINLKSSEDRRNSITRQMERLRLSYEIYPAVDGREISDETLEKIHSAGFYFKKSYGRNMERGEAGAALSHLRLYNKIVQEKIDCAIILEDDAEFDARLRHIAERKENLKKVLKNYDLILLGFCRNDLIYKKNAECSFWNRIKVDDIITVGAPVYWYWSAIGYLLTFEGAKKLLTQGEYPKMQADFLTANSPLYNVRLGIVKTPVVWAGPMSEVSTIRDVHEKLRANNEEQKSKSLHALKEKFRRFQMKASFNRYPFLIKDVDLK